MFNHNKSAIIINVHLQANPNTLPDIIGRPHHPQSTRGRLRARVYRLHHVTVIFVGSFIRGNAIYLNNTRQGTLSTPYSDSISPYTLYAAAIYDIIQHLLPRQQVDDERLPPELLITSSRTDTNDRPPLTYSSGVRTTRQTTGRIEAQRRGSPHSHRITYLVIP